jgi:hypothetical protein
VAVGQTARSIDQEGWRNRKAEARPQCSEPVELILSRRGDRGIRGRSRGARSRAGEVGVLDVGLDAEDGCSALPIVAGLATASETVGLVLRVVGMAPARSARV